MLNKQEGKDEAEEAEDQECWKSVGLVASEPGTQGLCSAWVGSFSNGHKVTPASQLSRRQQLADDTVRGPEKQMDSGGWG